MPKASKARGGRAGDLGYVEVKHEMSQDLLHLFADEFWCSSGGDGAELWRALNAHDWAALLQISHKLKGTAAIVGAPGVAKVAAELEDHIILGLPKGGVDGALVGKLIEKICDAMLSIDGAVNSRARR
ncbi:Hpt domain-containing protein [Caenispirillum bisanense]|uniref:Hpt domain-containing protein n=1 Tax=Caenispirillum bisanense TaxID=414052 RepID=UPI000BE3E2C3